MNGETRDEYGRRICYTHFLAVLEKHGPRKSDEVLLVVDDGDLTMCTWVNRAAYDAGTSHIKSSGTTVPLEMFDRALARSHADGFTSPCVYFGKYQGRAVCGSIRIGNPDEV